MTNPSSTAFTNLYPEVDPNVGLPLTAAERMALAASCAIMAFGVVSANMIVAGVGLLLGIASALFLSQKTARRIRNEARSRFPTLDWVEYRRSRELNLGLYIPLFWAVIIAVCAAGYWWIPPDYATVGAALIAVLVAALVWFMPGLNPMWSKPRKKSARSKKAEKDGLEELHAESGSAVGFAPEPDTRETAQAVPARHSLRSPLSDDTTIIPPVTGP